MKAYIGAALLLVSFLQNACTSISYEFQERAEQLHSRSGDPAAPFPFSDAKTPFNARFPSPSLLQR